MNALDVLSAAIAAGQRDELIRYFSGVAEALAMYHAPWWRWSIHLAAAISMRNNGIA